MERVQRMLSRVRFCVTSRTVARQAPLSVGILQKRILEWVSISCSRGSSQPKDQTHVSHISCINRWMFYRSATWEALCLKSRDEKQIREFFAAWYRDTWDFDYWQKKLW